MVLEFLHIGLHLVEEGATGRLGHGRVKASSEAIELRKAAGERRQRALECAERTALFVHKRKQLLGRALLEVRTGPLVGRSSWEEGQGREAGDLEARADLGILGIVYIDLGHHAMRVALQHARDLLVDRRQTLAVAAPRSIKLHEHVEVRIFHNAVEVVDVEFNGSGRSRWRHTALDL